MMTRRGSFFFVNGIISGMKRSMAATWERSCSVLCSVEREEDEVHELEEKLENSETTANNKRARRNTV
jgi:hypothetical protein